MTTLVAQADGPPFEHLFSFSFLSYWIYLFYSFYLEFSGNIYIFVCLPFYL